MSTDTFTLFHIYSEIITSFLRTEWNTVNSFITIIKLKIGNHLPDICSARRLREVNTLQLQKTMQQTTHKEINTKHDQFVIIFAAFGKHAAKKSVANPEKTTEVFPEEMDMLVVTAHEVIEARWVCEAIFCRWPYSAY